jgi:hypothetical protein
MLIVATKFAITVATGVVNKKSDAGAKNAVVGNMNVNAGDTIAGAVTIIAAGKKLDTKSRRG